MLSLRGPRNKRDVKFRGINADRQRGMGGRKRYIVTGTAKYIRDGGTDVTRDFNRAGTVDLGNPKN